MTYERIFPTDRHGNPIGPAVEEVVRCRDCRHFEVIKVRYSSKPIFACTAEWCEGSEGDNPLVELDGYCAWSLKREDKEK